MSVILLTEIPFAPDVETLRGTLRVRNQGDAQALQDLCAEAAALARPKAAYRPALVAQCSNDEILIDDVALSSRVLAANLEHVHRVFLYLATCGTELDAWAHKMDDIVHQFWAEEIKVQALRAAVRALNARIKADYHPGKTTTMNPGSLADWPLSQQRPFFRLMAEAARELGITLSDSCLMTPNKSVSGVRFPTESGFESCQLCPMPDCPGRRAPHDPELYARSYGAQGGAA
jgi:hypothetical protein